ncbi:serine/threonine-protein kinase [Rhodanobacter sp. ANJX3]|uniref:serine/threonine protein kinase n=1 Tax=Rhodanobacter sp. ANJX3 TaxID=2723083 RepID=UPI001613F51F|nr:protein kinase family protein [Rhodanobacter sp. ANJX3]MBB5357668.1 serine/threonine-protein kinase [Rhodanobacter sp. ANJX3]
MQLPDRYRTDLAAPSIVGGYGSVIPVHDTYLDRAVLFKTMHDPANNLQLTNEIRGLSKARSRHVVEIYDIVCDANGQVCGVVIEKLNGRDYRHFHLEALSDPQMYLRLIYQIATALRDLHEVGIVHRDIKLENIRESGSGILKLFDFGISCAGTGYHTRENRGSIVYAAPELYQPGVKINYSMDIYALGICCWALAANQFPQVLLERPPQQSGCAPSIDSIFKGAFPGEIVKLIDDCLSRSPQNRPSAQDISSKLERYLLRNLHRGIFVQGRTSIYELSSSSPQVSIAIPQMGEIKVFYDGLYFLIGFVTGNVFVNNVVAQPGATLPESCVLTFGAMTAGSSREWVTFQSSYPELVL